MTSQSPRIYMYKITFEEVLYYYYGVHKEKVFNEYYMGTPVTHKWVWDFYTPKKQILEVFAFSEEGWLEAQEVEKRIIKPFYRTDEWCLNENCGGVFSLDVCRKNGKIMGEKTKELGIGIFGLTERERKNNSRKAGKISGQKHKENETGIFGLSKEEKILNGQIGGKISGQNHKVNKTGVCGRTQEEMIEHGKKWGPIIGKVGGQKIYELGVGIFGLTPEEKNERNSKGGKISGIRNRENKIGIWGLTIEQRIENGKMGSKNTNSQVWECTITKYRSNPGGLSTYQKARGIDTSNRIRIK